MRLMQAGVSGHGRPQSRVPFSEASAKYIAGLDAERDLALLAAHGLAIRPACARVLRVCTMLLQKGVWQDP